MKAAPIIMHLGVTDVIWKPTGCVLAATTWSLSVFPSYVLTVLKFTQSILFCNIYIVQYFWTYGINIILTLITGVALLLLTVAGFVVKYICSWDLKALPGGAAGNLLGVSAAWHALVAAVYSYSVVSTSQALSTDSNMAQFSLCGPPWGPN